jgi:hypothetical protein
MELVCSHCHNHPPATSTDATVPLWGLKLSRWQLGGFEEFSNPISSLEASAEDDIVLCHDCSRMLYQFFKIPEEPIHHPSQNPLVRCCRYGYLPTDPQAERLLETHRSPSAIAPNP